MHDYSLILNQNTVKSVIAGGKKRDEGNKESVRLARGWQLHGIKYQSRTRYIFDIHLPCSESLPNQKKFFAPAFKSTKRVGEVSFTS